MSNTDYLRVETKRISEHCRIIEEQSYAVEEFMRGARTLGLHEMADTLSDISKQLLKSAKSIENSNCAIVSGMYHDTLQSSENILNACFAGIELKAREVARNESDNATVTL